MISAPDHRPTNRAFGGVIVEWDARVAEEAREAIPIRDDVRCGVPDREGLQRGLVPEPRLHSRDHLCTLRLSELRLLRDVALCQLIELVQLADPLHREVRLGMIR